MLEDRANVKTPVANKEPYFKVDPAFRGEAVEAGPNGAVKHRGVSYSQRYELLCRRLVLERLYNASCFLMATPVKPTVITQHQSMERPLAPHFETAYEMALQCRLNSMP